MYQRIAQDLRRRIAAGELPPGSQLPTEPELRQKYSASRNTVRDAIKVLIRDGLVIAQAGRGTFVSNEIDPFVTTLTNEPRTDFGGGEGVAYMSEVRMRKREPSYSQPQVEIQNATALIAERLRVEEGTKVVSRHQRRFIDDKPYSLQTSWYPFRLVERGAVKLLQAIDVQPGVVAYLEETLGIVQVGYQDLIWVRPPDDFESAFFELTRGSGVAMCEIARTAFDAEGQPFRLTITVYPTDRNRFLINVGDVPKDAMTLTDDTD
ncbi:transcriptional regulator [Actinomadura rubrobrunea]|uniref:Transcriptional regulator n=1 Tax=Actinomadura rubrobrunea TaxID=115335 RepID=A0A9W6PVX6_9ACTN|nr:GntR family transcriptional regulator [Actinomadura rubrobrunea]GLW65410.1 transcriptional regulator [Actinomadura rubrobrunea]